jgi:hypothetical protein
MTGALVLVFVIVVVLPVAFLMGGGVLGALLGWTLYKEAETRNADSELIDCNY